MPEAEMNREILKNSLVYFRSDALSCYLFIKQHRSYFQIRRMARFYWESHSVATTSGTSSHLRGALSRDKRCSRIA
ncbi:MAG: hypothetical protein VXZ27_10560 [SAR324 cluster bacterium]|nr:hypothetical protein [SAR324 cluster bacterium]